MDDVERVQAIQQVVLVTGPAGAGRTTAIHALEDLGFEAIDNLPLSLLPRVLDGPLPAPLAVGCDPRTRDFSATGLLDALRMLETAERPATLLYVDCAPRVLLRRYSETRRRHPSSPQGDPLVGIERELAMLAPLKAAAGVLVDTTTMTPHDLRSEIVRHFAPDEAGATLAVTLTSFSFKKGLPPGADMVLDARFLRNPHWQDELRPLDGRDAPVVAHVAEDPRWAPFLARVEDMVRFLLPAYRAEGKAYFTLAIGCTGGRHRSVAMVEALAKTLAGEGWQVSIRHRDLVVEVAGTAANARAEVGAQ